jgi:hypothetical protein
VSLLLLFKADWRPIGIRESLVRSAGKPLSDSGRALETIPRAALRVLAGFQLQSSDAAADARR